ncbi:hypothetical protein L226DRAFT_562209 [Lentinus tigrinus ALCF2SS1-7]|uniref:Uncharacterized protein n=1 Tax=Lentinus tigrinus ALCF2SS1-6 TaxID=1328759 RepID=A0A5C2S044_9APHY|nr:hypothetical protein L227DRAFT_633745 [Lentinus tigrinus ALCF2SS1-6]RPD71559.1 hypothetical protein L226DRAFT_562209 [Lentinus tigrinus ALCF2SS1-7]
MRKPANAPDFMLKELALGQSAPFTRTTSLSFLLVDCNKSLKASVNELPTLAYRLVTFKEPDEDRRRTDAYQDPAAGLGSEESDMTIQVDATTLWLACKACAAKWDPRDSKGWHFLQIACSDPGYVEVITRWDSGCGEYWLPKPESGIDSGQRDTQKCGSLELMRSECKWKLCILKDLGPGMGTFAVVPLEALLRAASEGMRVLEPAPLQGSATKPDAKQTFVYEFWSAEKFQPTLGYARVPLDEQGPQARYRGALLHTLLTTAMCRSAETWNLHCGTAWPIREQAITLGLQLRHFVPVVDPVVALCIALRASAISLDSMTTEEDASALIVEDLMSVEVPYWFGLLSTRRPFLDLPTFMAREERSSFPKAFPRGLEYDLPPLPSRLPPLPSRLPPLPSQEGLGFYFQTDIRVHSPLPNEQPLTGRLSKALKAQTQETPRRPVYFVAPVFPVSESASKYKLDLTNATDRGLHPAEAISSINIRGIPEGVLRSDYRILLLGEWLSTSSHAGSSSQIKEKQTKVPDCPGFMPQRALLICRYRCECTDIEELIKPQIWEQVAVLSLPRDWWKEVEKGTDVEEFRMLEPRHECPTSPGSTGSRADNEESSWKWNSYGSDSTSVLESRNSCRPDSTSVPGSRYRSMTEDPRRFRCCGL